MLSRGWCPQRLARGEFVRPDDGVVTHPHRPRSHHVGAPTLHGHELAELRCGIDVEGAGAARRGLRPEDEGRVGGRHVFSARDRRR